MLPCLLLLTAPVSAQWQEERRSLALRSGRQVDVRFAWPAATTTAKLPAIVLMGGFERGAGVLDLLPREAAAAVVVGFDYPVELPRRLRWWQVFELAPVVQRAIGDTVDLLLQLQSELAVHPRVDRERISVAGVSFGAPFALLAAARAPYAGIVLLHGFGHIPGTIRHQFARRWEPEYGWLGALMASLAQRVITALVDFPVPEASARRLSPEQRVLLITAAVDEFVPAASTQSLIDALRASPASLTVLQTPGQHVRGHRAEVVAALHAQALGWMHDSGLLGEAPLGAVP